MFELFINGYPVKYFLNKMKNKHLLNFNTKS